MKVVVSQSMYFPWIGLLEQIRLADVFVHYDDVQYARGFYNRVQVKTPQGQKWITVPLCKHHRNARIDQVSIDDTTDWRSKHREILRHNYSKAPYLSEMLSLVDSVFNLPAKNLKDISRASLLALSDYFGLSENTVFVDSAQLSVEGSGSQRLLSIVKLLDATRYITGHGAANYLDHTVFDEQGVGVEYMDYAGMPYSQLHGGFTPYVSGLDLVANLGKDGGKWLLSETVCWKRFLRKGNV